MPGCELRFDLGAQRGGIVGGLRPVVRLVEDQPAGFPAPGVLLDERQDPEPPIRRARKEAGPFAPRGFVDGRHGFQPLARRQQPERSLTGPLACETDRAGLRFEIHATSGKAESEALVDRALGCPQRCERLATAVAVVDHEPHHPAHQAATAMRGQDRDEGDAAGRKLSAGYAQIQ